MSDQSIVWLLIHKTILGQPVLLTTVIYLEVLLSVLNHFVVVFKVFFLLTLSLMPSHTNSLTPALFYHSVIVFVINFTHDFF